MDPIRGHARSRFARLPILISVLLATSSLVACSDSPSVTYVVDEFTASADPQGCTDGAVYKTLGAALQCAVNSTADLTAVILQCSQPNVSYCDYQLPADMRLARNANGKRISLSGEPTRMPRIKYQYMPGKPPISIEDKWMVSGITIDGDRTGPSTSRALVNLIGSDISFIHNEVHNTQSNCIYIGDPTDRRTPGRVQTHDVLVAYNKIHDCYDPNDRNERYGTYAHDTNNLTIAYNDIWRVSGDAFQNLNTRLTKFSDPTQMLPPDDRGAVGVASNTHIIGNRMWSACYIRPSGPAAAYGENAIDIKRTGAGLIIRDNLIWGYRQSFDQTVQCHGTGSGDPGYGIVVHGQIERQTGPATTQLCSAASPADPPCGLIEGNTISFSQGGIAVGTEGGTEDLLGHTYGVTVRGNYITDMQGIKPSSPNKRGLGMALVTPGSPDPPGNYNKIYRNTLVNIYGNSFEADSSKTSFRVVNNLIAYTAPKEDETGQPSCKAPGLGGGPEFKNNWWYKALAPPPPPPPDVQEGPITFAAHSQIVPPSCGRPMYTWKDPHGVNEPSPWDYRLSPCGGGVCSPIPPKKVLDGGGQMAEFRERHSEMPGYCDSDYGIGADEYCSFNLKVYLAETGDPADRWPKPVEEIYQGVSPWWLSPDLGARQDRTAPFTIPAGDSIGGVPLGTSPPAFSRQQPDTGELLLRVRGGGALSVPEPIRVRIWGSPLPKIPANESAPGPPPDIFPRGYELLLDTTVEFNGAASGKIERGMMAGGAWRKLVGNPDVHIYGFDWRLPGAKHPEFSDPKVQGLERYGLVAEIGAGDPQAIGESDQRPPFGTKVDRSNNLAMRAIYVDRQPISSGNYLPRSG
jgi:hypothetical protein